MSSLNMALVSVTLTEAHVRQSLRSCDVQVDRGRDFGKVTMFSFSLAHSWRAGLGPALSDKQGCNQYVCVCIYDMYLLYIYIYRYA